jgi:uncharacterized protein
MTQVIVGFLIAATVGLTGVGGGSFTTPALVLLVGLPAAEAVGTALVFAAILRLIAAPFYVVRRLVNGRYLRLLLLGALPGLVLGTWLLRLMQQRTWNPLVLVIIGALLAGSAAVTFIPRMQRPRFAKEKGGWLSLLALPIGLETGFSSAGAGALGSVLLLNYSELTAPEVVGTDLLFGIGLAVFGSAIHLSWGSMNHGVLMRLLAGGVPGVLLGCLLAKRVSSGRLRTVVALVAIALGLQLIWMGCRPLIRDLSFDHSANPSLAPSTSQATSRLASTAQVGAERSPARSCCSR